MSIVRTRLPIGIWALFVLGCTSEPRTCDEAACNGATEMCVLFASDTFAPNEATCQPILAGCEADRTCTCIDAAIGEEGALRFCFDVGGCTLNGEVLEVICPGG